MTMELLVSCHDIRLQDNVPISNVFQYQLISNAGSNYDHVANNVNVLMNSQLE